MPRPLIAVNTAPDSENRMHGDEARRYGFRGGLVPGVDVLGYLAHEAVERWGPDWLAGGRLDGRLDAPVYDAEAIEVDAQEQDGALVAAVRGAGAPDDVRARAELSLLTPKDKADVVAAAASPAFATAPMPDAGARPPASRDTLAPGTVLGTQFAGYHAALAPHYLDELSEAHAAFRVDGFAHPGWLLRFANWALARTVRLGPWIHVSSDASFLAPVRDGDRLEVRAVVTQCFERKGHELVDLDVVYLVATAPVLLVHHRAIWRPRSTA